MASAAQYVEHALDFIAQRGEIRPAGAATARLRRLRDDLVQSVARTADGETLLVEQIADTPDQQHLVMLIIASVAAALDRLELRELLFPVSQYVRLDATQFADFTDCKVTLGGYRWQRFLRAVGYFHRCSFVQPLLSASAKHGRSPRAEP